MTSPSPHSKAGLRGDIEGLRAIAVLMVVLYHVTFPGVTGGFAGVDVFFVISGYLITDLLVREFSRTGTVSLRTFYARRARRLLPAAAVVLIFSAVAGWLLLPESRHGELGLDVLAATLYVVNWALAARSVDYLAEDSEPSLVQHFWSLSVEEQYYVLWPILILLGLWLARRAGVRVKSLIGTMLLVLVLTSLWWSVVHTAEDPSLAYFATTTRVWELGIGGLLVFLAKPLSAVPRAVADLAALAGVVLIVVSALGFTSATPWPGSAALLPTVGTALVIAAGIGSQETWSARVLGVAPMRFVGGLSYGYYLWHWPLLQLLDVVRPGSGLKARIAVALVGLVLAWVTLRMVENPIRFNPSLAKVPARALAMGATTMVVSSAVAVALWANAPRVGELPSDALGAIALTTEASRSSGEPQMITDPSSVYTTSGEISPPPGAATRDVPRPYGMEYDECQVGRSVVSVPSDPCSVGDEDSDIEVALVGDSKMLQWLPALLPIAEQEGWHITSYTKSACGFVTSAEYPECLEYNADLKAHLADAENTPDIILSSMGTPGKSKGEQLAENLRPAEENGAQIVFVTDNPIGDRDDRLDDMTWYECVGEHPESYGTCSFPYAEGDGTSALRAAHEEMPGSVLIDLNQWICPPETAVPGAPDDEARCPSVIGEVLLFRQGSHLTASYVRTLTPHMHAALVDAGIAKTSVEDIAWRVPPASQETAKN